MDISVLLKDKIKQAVKEVYGIEVTNVLLEHPANEKWGDFATNIAMELSKALKQNPFDIAKSVSYKIDQYDMVYEANGKIIRIFDNINVVQPGFINFVLSSEWLQFILYDIQRSPEDYGKKNIGQNLRIALEHSNVNPNKAAHVGHLRNACIGQFIEKIYEFLGYDVEVQYYANDVGVQVASTAIGIEKVSEVKPDDFKKYDHYAWDVYTKIEKLMGENESLRREREALMLKLEDRKSPEAKKVQAFADKILLDHLDTFAKLNIDYDIVIHESDILGLKLWDLTFEKLKQNTSVYFAVSGPSKGCWLIKMEEEVHESVKSSDLNIEKDKILVRSNGIPTYTGKDIAYHMWKFGLLPADFHYKKLETSTQEKTLWSTTSESQNSDLSFKGVNKVFNVIDVKQSYAMEAVKLALASLGYEEASTNMVHINYGFVYLSAKTARSLGIDISDGKDRYAMSGRKGWGIKIDDLIDSIDEKLTAEYGQYPAKKDIRNGAIKFEMVKFNTFQDLVFDLDDALSIKGYSGPYLQYTHARCFSLLNKADFRPDQSFYQNDIVNVKQSINAHEVALLKWIYRYPEVLERAAMEYSPNYLCEYLFNLCQRFNAFYNDDPILDADNAYSRNFRLMLTKCVKDIVKSGLGLLGIVAPDKI